MKIPELTRAELQVMNYLWDKGEATVGEILAEYPEPKPAYTTIATVLRVLTVKEFVKVHLESRVKHFVPLVSREAYTTSFMASVKKDFFKNSFASMVSFFARREKLDSRELEELIALLRESNTEGRNSGESTPNL
ncbi:MAG: BlaI/MecI/CopY family transcriptional regulator [Bacteroidaceae bacterium]|jgi:BlaI family penicillinase repressor